MPGGLLLADDQPSVSVIDHERLRSVDAPSSSPGRGGRIATLTSLVVILELVFFRGAFSGTVIPPWDFVGSYNTDAYYWTLHGSFFSPVAWVPTTWAGYPGAAILQNGAWYLPTELVSAVWPYTLHVAAAVAAAHVAWGLIGAYLLVHRLVGSFWVSVFAGLAWFFAAGFYANAEHVDIARGYAWVPWVMLVLSTRWRWTSWWQAPVAALVLWQATTAMYPGQVIALAYVGVVWVAYWQWVERPRLREYLVPLLVAGVVVVLLSAPRLLPYFLLGAGEMATPPDDSRFSPILVGTLLYGFGSSELPNYISMRSFFVPATVLAMVVWAPIRNRTTGAGVALALPALALGMPFLPWFIASQSLPGLALSRFGMSDFKVFLLLGLVLIAAAGAERLHTHPPRLSNRADALRVGGTVVLVAIMLTIALQGPFSLLEWVPEWCMLVLAAAIPYAAGRGLGRGPVVGGLLVVTIVSGAMWTQINIFTWQVPRLETERSTYGATVSELVSTPRLPATTQRPAREDLPEDYTWAALTVSSWNAAYFSERLTVGGYLVLRSFSSQDKLEAALLDPVVGPTYARFTTAAGMAVSRAAAGPVTDIDVARCLDGDGCGPASMTPAGYRAGAMSYQVSSPEPVVALFNEAYYPGWRAEVCPTSEPCSPVSVAGSEQGLLSASLPSGSYTLALSYHTPGLGAAWAAFATAVSMLVLWAGAGLTRHRRRARLDARRHGVVDA